MNVEITATSGPLEDRTDPKTFARLLKPYVGKNIGFALLNLEFSSEEGVLRGIDATNPEDPVISILKCRRYHRADIESLTGGRVSYKNTGDDVDNRVDFDAVCDNRKGKTVRITLKDGSTITGLAKRFKDYLSDDEHFIDVTGDDETECDRYRYSELKSVSPSPGEYADFLDLRKIGIRSPVIPPEKLGILKPFPLGRRSVSSKLAAIADGMVEGTFQLEELAAKYGYSLEELDVPRGASHPLRLRSLYSQVHETKYISGDKVHTVCLGLMNYPGDPRPDMAYTRDVERYDNTCFVQNNQSTVNTYWEHVDPPEKDFPDAYAEGITNISSWVKCHLIVPHSKGNPHMALSLQYSNLNPGGWNAFGQVLDDEISGLKQELARRRGGGAVNEGPVSFRELSNNRLDKMRRKADWRKKHKSSPYLFQDRDMALALVALELGEKAGVNVINTRYLKDEGRAKAFLESGKNDLIIV